MNDPRVTRMSDETKVVYVVSFFPDFTNWHDDETARVGGFDWRSSFDEASMILRKHLDDGETGHDYTLRSFQVPRDLSNDDITTYLNERADLRELPQPEEWIT